MESSKVIDPEIREIVRIKFAESGQRPEQACFPAAADLIRKAYDPLIKATARRGNLPDCSVRPSLLNENPFIQSCSPDLRERLKRLYGSIDRITVSRSNFEILANEIIPLTGMTRGCIFLHDPGSHALEPRRSLGACTIASYPKLTCTQPDENSDPILQAFSKNPPVVGKMLGAHQVVTSCISGSLGLKQKAGVLHLEFPFLAQGTGKDSLMTAFKAIQRAVSHCLCLK